MNEFMDIFERINEEVDPEYSLSEKLENIIQEYTEALKGDYWFDSNVFYHISDVIKWLREHSSELYKKSLEDPSELEGKDEVINALQALGYMKDWSEFEEDELQDPEDVERWRTAMGYYGTE